MSVALLAVAALAGCGADDTGTLAEPSAAADAAADAGTVASNADAADTAIPTDTDTAAVPDTAADATDAASTDAPAALGPLAFTAPLVGGGTFDGSTYGERPVVLWFWAPG